jgi:multiple sugar transport system permease protein
MARTKLSRGFRSDPALAPRRGKRRLSKRTGELVWGYGFIAPWIVGFILLTLIPMVASLYFSFTDYILIGTEPYSGIDFTGLENWRRLLGDENAHNAALVTLSYTIRAVPVFMVFPLALAVLLNSPYLRAKKLFRLLFYLPITMPGVAVAMMWQGMLNPRSGWIAKALEFFGIQGPLWFIDPGWVYPGFILMGLWGTGNAMIFFLAGFQRVPQELYDAAIVDGAGARARLFKITLPLLSPMLLFNFVIETIAALQFFTYVMIVNTGLDGSRQYNFYTMYVWRKGWSTGEMGYACTLAWAMFLFVLLFLGLVFWVSRRWVYYAYER